MKKILFLLFGLLFSLSMTFIVSCDFIIDIRNVEVINQPDEAVYELGGFKYDDYSILVTYTDGSTNTIVVDESMFSDYDNLLLNSVGTHDVNINYEGYELTIRVKINYKAVVENEEKQIVEPYIEPIDTVYDGTAKVIKVEGDIPENATIYYPNGQSFTDAGEYTATATIVADGYETINLSAKVSIKKADYDLSGLSLVVDYGVDKENNPLTSFVYDGKEHGATLVGDIPEGLSKPEYLIGLRSKPLSTYTEGNSATNAGLYVVVAKFTGDSLNYNTDNLEIKTELIIDKKPVTQEGFESLSYPIKYVNYDGLPHRYVIDDLTLPTGVSIEYLDENGKQFGERTEANEDGYKITAKFVSSDPNLDLTNSIDLVLVIHRVAYKIDQKDITVTFEEGTEIDFDNLEHQVVVKGLVDGITLKTFTVNGEENTVVKNAGEYEVYVEFNPFNSNYLPIDPITTTLKINQIGFTSISYQFDDKLEEIYDEEGHSLEYNSYSMPVGVSISFTYQTDNDFETHQGIPKDIIDVGTYICTGKYSYDKNNYKDAPESIDDVIATMVISQRVYDAKTVIELDPITAFYSAGKNHINLCTFDEKIPSWITGYRALVYTNNGTTSTKTVIDAGEYEYEFEFFYFDGLENTSAKTNRETLKVIGQTVNSTNYKVSYTSTGEYDGINSCLPTISLFFEEYANATWSLEYSYQSFDSAEPVIVDKSEWSEVSKNAGTHTFSYTITAKNYEPLKKTYTVVVDRKPLLVNHLYYSVSNYEGVYDGEVHANQISVIPYTGSDAIVATPKLLSSSKEGLESAKDVGVYEYTVEFKSSNSNYTIVLDTFYSFNYTVKINSLELEKPNDLITFSLDNSVDTKNVTVNKTAKFYSALSSFLGATGDSPITTNYLEYNGTYTLDGYDLEYNNPTKTIENSSLNNVSYVVYNKDTDEINNVNSIEEVNEKTSDAGTYLILMNFGTNNIVVNGRSGILYQIKVDPCEINLANPEKYVSDTYIEVNSNSTTSFNLVGEGVSSLAGDEVDEINAFDGTIMLNYSTTYFGSKLFVNLQKSLSENIIDDMDSKYYLVKVTSKGEIIKDSSFNNIFPLINGDYLRLSENQSSDAAVYYVFADLGVNYSYLSNRRVVYKIVIEGKEFKVTDIVDVVDNTKASATTYNVNNFRKYVTEKDKFTCALENNSKVENADNVTNTSGFSGLDIYTYSVDFYSNLYSLDLFKNGFSEADLADIKLDVIFAGYSVSNGGRTIKTLSTDTYIRKSKITVAQLKSYVNDLYLSNSQKEYTPVGVYYLFITFDSNNYLINGNNKVAICVQVNRSTDSKYYTYSYGGKSYNLLTDGIVSPFKIKFVDNQYKYTFTDKSMLPLNDKITSVTSDVLTFDSTRAISSWFTSPYTFNNIEITFNQEMYGGYVYKLNTQSVTIYYEKRSIDLTTIFTSQYSITTTDDGKRLEFNGTEHSDSEWQNNFYKYFEDNLTKIGVDKKIANYFAVNYTSFGQVYSTQAHTIGTTYLDLYVGIRVQEYSLTAEQKAIRTCIKSLFNITKGSAWRNDYYSNADTYTMSSTSSAGVKVVIAKRRVIITRYLDARGWYDDQYVGSADSTSKDDCLETPYFTGYLDEWYKGTISGYTSEDNLFLSCIIDDTTRGFSLSDFLAKCVTVTTLSTEKVSIKVEMGGTNYSDYFEIYERQIRKVDNQELNVVSWGLSYTVETYYKSN